MEMFWHQNGVDPHNAKIGALYKAHAAQLSWAGPEEELVFALGGRVMRDLLEWQVSRNAGGPSRSVKSREICGKF